MYKRCVGGVRQAYSRCTGSGRFLARPDRWKVCHEEIRHSHRSFGCTGRRGVGIGRYGCPRSCVPCAHACADAVREWSLSSRAGRRGRRSHPPIHFGRPLPEGPGRRHRPAFLICHAPRQRWAQQSRRRNWGQRSARRSPPVTTCLSARDRRLRLDQITYARVVGQCTWLRGVVPAVSDGVVPHRFRTRPSFAPMGTSTQDSRTVTR